MTIAKRMHLIKGQLGTFGGTEETVLLVTPALGHTGDEMVLSSRDWRLDVADIIGREKSAQAAVAAILESITPIESEPITVYVFKPKKTDPNLVDLEPVQWVYDSVLGSLWRDNPEAPTKPTKHTAQDLFDILEADKLAVGEHWPERLGATQGLNNVRFQRGEW